jgi:hypothetical protein
LATAPNTAVTQYDNSISIFHPERGQRGMVASEQRLATQVGVDILAQGGNAIDAAVGVGFALAVVLPNAGNLGGGGFMLIQTAKASKPVALDFREVAPASASRDMYLDEKDRVIAGKSTQSPYAVGVPGSVAGLVRALQDYGTLSLEQVIAPAIQLAEKGFTGDPEIFDGAMSLGDVFSREWNSELLAKNLNLWGKPFMIVSPGATFKLYPCGRPPLFAVDCAIAIRDAHNIQAENIEKIFCDVSFLYPRTLIHTNPKNGLQAKASLQYCIATSLLDGRPTLASFTNDAVNREAIKNLIDRIEVRVPPHLSEDVPAVRKAPFEQPVTLEVHTKDGKT